MSIGQGDMRTTPLQMATTYAAIANRGTVWAPKIGMSLQRQEQDGTIKTLREFKHVERSRTCLWTAPSWG